MSGELDQKPQTDMGWSTPRQDIPDSLSHPKATPDTLHAEREFVKYGDTTSSRTMQGYKPEAGRADKHSSNVPGGNR